MKRRRRTPIVLLLLFMFLLIPLWAVFHDRNGGEVNLFGLFQKQENQSQVSPKILDQVLAKDLSLTTSLFVDQLSAQIDRWEEYDVSSAEMKEQFERELKEHKHFHSFAYVNGEKIEVKKGELSSVELEKIKELTKSEKDVYYSDPYEKGEKQFMMVAKKNKENKWIVGEVDLSFVKRFVGELASVADANGNFFISQDGTKVKFENEEEGDKGRATEEVPELGWQIVVQSTGEQEEQEKVHFRKGEAIVKFRGDMDIEEWLGNEPQIRVKKESPPYYLLVHEQMDTDEFVASLRNQAGFESVEPNYIYTKQTTGAVQEPNDEFYQPYQWNLSQIQVKEGWEISSGSEEVIIAVLDTGVDLKHQDIAEKMVEGFNAFDGSSDPTDEHGHGTHVAGISSAITNNVKGIAGVSWRNRIMPIKVLDEKGEGSLFEITSGIRWATDHGAKVINMSLGDTENSPMLYDAIRYAYEHDVMLIAAAGNDNVSQMMYPAGYEEVLAVSAVNPDKTKAEFSNYGSHIDVAAPGESIPSLFPDNHYVYMSGTSMAAPHVSGMAGLIRSVRPDLSNEEVMNLIRHTAEDLGDEGHDSYFGYGLINVAKALEYVQAHREVAFANAERTRELEEPWYLYFFRELFNR